MTKTKIFDCPHPNNCKLWDTCERKFEMKYRTYYKRKKNGLELCKILNPLEKDRSKEKHNFFINKLERLIGYTENNEQICKCPHPNNCELWDTCERKFEVKYRTYYKRKKNGLELCTIVNPVNIQEKRKNFIKNNTNWLIDYTSNGDWICKCPHPNDCINWDSCDHQFILDISTYQSRKLNNRETCVKLKPKGVRQRSQFENNICKIFDNLFIKYKRNCKNLIKNNDNNCIEIDIVPNNSNVLIECNGCFWHSMENPKIDKNQHILKFKKCLEKGYELISIWEDWNYSDVYHFLKRKFEGKDISMYKTLWFPDLKENEWPLDLGWYNDIPPSPNEINPHFCIHIDTTPKYNRKYSCFDSGVIIISD